jgi:hypothetical protein
MFGILAFFYGKTALSTRANYATGLLIFSLLLLAQSVGTASAYLFLGEYFGNYALPYMALMGSLELLGALALLRITL